MLWLNSLCLVGVVWGLSMLVAGFLPARSALPLEVQEATGMIAGGTFSYVLYTVRAGPVWATLRSIPRWWRLLLLASLLVAATTFIAFLLDGTHGRPVMQEDVHVQLLQQRHLGAEVAVSMAAAGAISAGKKALSDRAEPTRVRPRGPRRSTPARRKSSTHARSRKRRSR